MSVFKSDSEQMQKSKSPLVSRSTILILSGFLIGSVFRDYAETRLERNILFAGLIGIVAYIGLVFGTQSHSRRKQRVANDKATSEMDDRIERHIGEAGLTSAHEIECRVQKQVEELSDTLTKSDPFLATEASR